MSDPPLFLCSHPSSPSTMPHLELLPGLLTHLTYPFSLSSQVSELWSGVPFWITDLILNCHWPYPMYLKLLCPLVLRCKTLPRTPPHTPTSPATLSPCSLCSSLVSGRAPFIHSLLQHDPPTRASASLFGSELRHHQKLP